MPVSKNFIKRKMFYTFLILNTTGNVIKELHVKSSCKKNSNG